MTNFNMEKFATNTTASGGVTTAAGITTAASESPIKDIKVHFTIDEIGTHEQDDNNKGKNQILIKWDKIRDINKYVLVIYINNAGPFLKIFNTTDANDANDANDDNLKVNDDSMEFVYHIKNNVTYKFIIYAVDDDNQISKTNIKTKKLSSFNNDVNKNTNSFESKILCNANGKHKIISSNKCEKLSNRLDDNSIIAKDTFNSNCMDDTKNIQCFNTANYDTLMKDLSKTNPVQIKVIF